MPLSSLPLSYCTNVHPGQTVDAVIDGLHCHAAEAQRKFGDSIAAGLWLSRRVVDELLQDQRQLEQLGQTLWQHDLMCYTLNTFPYGDFHSDRVKENVYLPDWASDERLSYTSDCAAILAQLLPPGIEGSLSTVPLGGTMNPGVPDFEERCFERLIHAAVELSRLQEQSGRVIRLAIEPEPLCHLSSVPRDVIPWFRQLRERAAAAGHEGVVQEFIGVCFDVCHQAVEFEDVASSITLLNDHGIRINKVHITNAVELAHPANSAAGREALQAYVEPRYLHQTYARLTDGRVLTRMDLKRDDITREPPDEFLQADCWRVHFHVPVYAESLGPLSTTHRELRAGLARIPALAYTPHLEVETYTWPVMPNGQDAPRELADRIAAELRAATDMITHTKS